MPLESAKPAASRPVPTLLSWSSGKDSLWALRCLRADPGVEVRGLLTSCNETAGRVAIHGVRRSLLETQAAALGLPVSYIDLPHPCSNATYERLAAAALSEAKSAGIEAIAFGDLFLEDIRTYRERLVEPLGLRCRFPIWGLDTTELAREMVSSGVRARVACVDPNQCPAHLAGAEFDEAFLATLPPGVDPCGERGEFHTFAYDGPGFESPITVAVGDIVERDGFHFADLLPEVCI